MKEDSEEAQKSLAGREEGEEQSLGPLEVLPRSSQVKHPGW